MIRQRGNNREVRIRREGWPKLTKSFNSNADARAWATVIESEIESDIFIHRTGAEKNILGEALSWQDISSGVL